MAQNSNSSGSGNLLVRGFMGILSITATAVVSTIVQRYMSTNTAPAWSPASVPPAAQPSPNADLQPTVSGSVPTDPASLDSSRLEANQPGINQPGINQSGTSQPGTSQPDRSIEAGRSDSPIQVETQPVPDSSSFNAREAAGNSAEQPASSEPSTDAALRGKLDSALRDKWNKH